MAELSKAQLTQENGTSFPNNNSGYITPEILRNYNQDVIDSTVNQSVYTTDSASFDSRIDGLTVDTSSLVTTASFNAFTASYEIDSASFTFRINSFASSSIPAGTVSSSQQIVDLGFATTQSVNTLSSSIFQTDATQSNQISELSASNAFNHSRFATTGSNTFVGNQTVNGAISASGNISASSLWVNNGTIVNLTTIYETSSVIYSSGSNQLGDALSDVQILSGSVLIVGSGSINGSRIITSADTASMAVSSSTYAVTASYAVNAQTASEARNLVIIATNGNQSTLSAGTVVRISGANGDNPVFNTASFDSETLSSNTLGILRSTTNSGAAAEVVVNGIVLGVNTDPTLGYVAGDVLYLSASGQFTRVQPQAPQQIVTLGEVLRAQQNNGSIYVNVSNGWELNELHNVQINTPLTNDLLAYESSSYGLWKNKSFSSLGLATTSSVNSVSTSVGLLETFSGSQYKADSASFTTRIDAAGGAPQIQDEGSILGNATSFNFIGAGVSVAVASNTASVTIAGGGGSIDTGSFITTGSATTASQTVLGDFKFNTTYVTSSGYVNQAGGAAVLGIDYGAFDDILNYWGGQDFANITVNGTGVSNASITSYNFGSYLELNLSSGTTTNGATYTLTGPVYQTIDVTGSIAATQELKVIAANGNINGIDKSAVYSKNPTGTIQANLQASDGINIGENVNFDYLRLIITGSQNGAGAEYAGAQISMGANFTNRTQFGFQGTTNYTDGRITAFQPLFLSQSLIVSGAASFAELTGSLSAFSASVDSRLDAGATTGSNNFVGTETISGSLKVTGSVAGNVEVLTVASSTASIDLSKGTFFTLTIPSSSVTFITATNITPGTTANIVLTQQSTTGSVRFDSMFKFPSGSINTGSAVASAVDLVSVMSVNTTTLYSVGAKQLI